MKILKNVSLYGSITDIKVENGKIYEIGKCQEGGVDFSGLKIFPGLIDTHSHAVLTYDTADEENHLEEMADYYLSQGTTCWYPTNGALPKEILYKVFHRNLKFGHGADIPGFHMEGPFLSPTHRGAHLEENLVLPDLQWIYDCPNIKRVTLAPELPGGMEFIRKCPVQTTVGHTNATYDIAKEAFMNGATCLTHTFNAMNGIHHRAPGPIGAASDTPWVYTELICDGYHIHPASVRMLAKIMGVDRVVLVSDTIRGAGMADGVYESIGSMITIKDGKALTPDGAIAGSTTTLFGCVKKAIEFGFSEEVAVKMASENPARMMGLNKGRIVCGYDADFILVDEKFNLVKSIVRGEF